MLGSHSAIDPDGFWYDSLGNAPRFYFEKYSSDLKLLSIYDVDTKVLTTAPIDIAKIGGNKVKLILNTSGTDYKTYISNDKANWQEVTDIVSDTPKELDVDGWNSLYIKIETNTSRINSIEVK